MSSLGAVRFLIASPLSAIRSPQADHADVRPAHRDDRHVKAARDRTEDDGPGLSITFDVHPQGNTYRSISANWASERWCFATLLASLIGSKVTTTQ
jgi:hypothetical protein